MNRNDYVILFDENGSPYIAHAGIIDSARNAVNAATNRVQQVANQAKGVGRGVRQNHKYILKVNENGKTRYFYKQEEVRAYYEAKKRGIKNAAEYAQNAVKNKASEVADKAKQSISNAKNAVREATGQAARDRMNEADSKYAALNQAQNEKYASYKKAQNERKYADYKTLGATIDQKIAEDKAQNANFFNRKHKETEAEIARNQQQQYQAISNQKKAAEDKAKKELDTAIDAYNKNAGDYYDNKRMYDKSLAGAVDRTAARARDIASDAKDTASAAYNKAKDSANNTVTNAKNRFERMKSEFRDKTGQTLKDRAETAEQEAKDAERERQKAAGRYSHDVDAALKSEKNLNANPNSAHAQAERDRTVSELRKSSEDYYKDGGALDNAQSKRDEAAKARKEYNDFKKSNSVQAMIDQARTAVKDKAEDLSAKAKSTAQAAKESAQGMIENARSSTAKAVNEAWDKIPKNADGTVNPFDSNFQSAYNDWKSKKDKYDGSLTGQAKAVAEKATDSVKDMIDKARKAISSEPPTPRLSNPNKPLEIENIETENIIKENRIPERRTMEQRIEESRIPERIESTKQTAEEQRSNDKRAAQHLSASAELKGGEYVSLIDKYKQRYGEDYQKYLSKDETSRLQKARDNYQMAVEDANRAWDEFDKKWSKNK